MPQPILQAHTLVKQYGDKTAVAGISFEIEEGEVFGLLGPNGAGKSTTIAMLSCLLPPTSGSATVCGADITRESARVRACIGVVPQGLALYPTLSARANLRFFGEMYGLHGRALRSRIDGALEVVAMRDRADDRVETYSGGMKRRINLAIGLINQPRLLFLDEPTVGVDPQSRNHIFESVEQLSREQKMGILYTTHYMEEAQRLCRRVGIIDKGRLIALDTPRALIAMLGGGIIQIGVQNQDDTLLAAVAALPAVTSADWAHPASDAAHAVANDTLPEPPPYLRALLKVETSRQETALIEIVNLFGQRDVEMLSLETLEPNLESVFLHLTGKTLRS